MKTITFLFITLILILNLSCNSANLNNLKEASKIHGKTKNKYEYYSYYTSPEGKEVRHGLSSFINIKDKKIQRERHVYYVDDNKEGLEIIKGKYQTILVFYKKNIVTNVSFFNNRGGKIASCLMKNGKPYNGNIWSLAFGLQGVKWNRITTYKKGKSIKEKDCDLQGYFLYHPNP